MSDNTNILCKERIYNANRALTIVGHQECATYLTEDFITTLEAHRRLYGDTEALFEAALNFFVLGVVTGKRLERAEKQHREFIPFTYNEE